MMDESITAPSMAGLTSLYCPSPKLKTLLVSKLGRHRVVRQGSQARDCTGGREERREVNMLAG